MAEPRVVRLVDIQAQLRERARQAALARVAELVRSATGFTDPEHVAALVTALSQLAGAAQLRTASLTAAYLARVIGELRGRPVQPVGVQVQPGRLRGGVDPSTVYQRVAQEYRYRRSVGDGDTEARDKAATRAQVIVSDDLQLAAREAAQQVYQATPGVTGYRRVIRPELSRSGTCGLCIAASDRTYHTGELLPIHARCQCETLPIIGANDPGRTLNSDELAELYAAAGGRKASQLSTVRYAVREHGELGPVLRHEQDHFRGPDEVADALAA